MKYALLIYDNTDAQPAVPSEHQHLIHAEYHTIAQSPGLIAHYRLATPRRAATVRVQDGQTRVEDGPHAATPETLRAIYLIHSDNRDQILEIAAALPAARTGGAVEVWPLSEPSRDTRRESQR